MGTFGLGDEVTKDDKTNHKHQSDKKTDKAVEEKRQAKEEAQVCEFC